MPAPICAALVEDARIRSSGANGCPLTMPIAASWPARSGSSASAGSSWTSSSISSKKEKSLACTVLTTLGEVDEHVVAPGCRLPASG